LDALIALSVAALAPALNVLFLRRLSPQTREVLLWPKSEFSELMGNALGWSEHIKQSDPVGLWLQLALIAIVVAGVIFLALSAVSARRSSQEVFSSVPAILAVSIPWVCLLLIIDTNVFQEIEAIHLVVLLGPTMAIALSIHGVTLIRRNRWNESRLYLALGVTLNALLYMAFASYVDGYFRPVAYFAVTTSCIFLVSWTRACRPEAVLDGDSP
jgi:phosphatidylserine synthase